MWEYITHKSIFWHKWTLLFATIFILFRVFSFVLMPYPYIMSAIIIVLMFLFGMLYFQSPPHAFLLLLAEFFLGGSGMYFDMFGISIRSLFLICFLTLTFMHQIGIHFYHEQKHIPTWLIASISAILVYTVIAIVNGINSGHSITALNEAVPFFYLLIVFPAYAMYRRHPFLRTNTARLAVVAILGIEIFTFINAALFASGITTIGGSYYDWFVSMNGGSILLAQDPLHYIIEPSNILVIPILLIVTSLLMRSEKHHWLWWTLHAFLLLKLTLAPNIWFAIALGVGLIVLFVRHSTLRWAGITAYTTALFFGFVLATSLLFSGFTTSGLPILFSTAQAQLTDAATIGHMQFPAVMNMVEQAPLFGIGFGSSITYFDTILETYQTTDTYVWNYFKLLVEVGIIGIILYGILIGGIMLTTVRRIWQLHDYHDFYVGILAAIVSLLIMQFGMPVLTSSYGIFALIFGVLIITKSPSVFDQFVIFLYQLFHSKQA